jgi:hypothetical protein
MKIRQSESIEFLSILFLKSLKTGYFHAVGFPNGNESIEFLSILFLKSLKTGYFHAVGFPSGSESIEFLSSSFAESLKTHVFLIAGFKNHGFYMCDFQKMTTASYKTITFSPQTKPRTIS